jgi:hypothetical protein
LKRLFSVFLLLILFVPTLFKVGVEVYYELNKEYIATNLCVNKDRPITMCFGRCFVDQKIQMIDQAPIQSSSLSQVTLDLSDFLVSDFVLEEPATNLSLDFSLTQGPSVIDGHLISVFRPPLG